MQKNKLDKRSPLSSFVELIRGHLGILAALLVMCIALSIATDSFLTSKNIFNVLRQIAVNVFLACSMTLVIILGGIDLSVGSTVAISGCVCASLITKMGWSPYPAILLAIAIGGVIGCINGLIASCTTIPPFIITLATMNIGRGLARVIVSNKTVAVDNDIYKFIGSGYVGGIPIHVIFIVIVVAVTSVILSRTQFGRGIYAVGGNKMAAKYSGLNPQRITFFVFVINGLLAGCTGILSSSRTMVGQYSLGEGAEMDAITAVVLGGTSMTGGVGNISGTVIGCLIVGVLKNGMNLLGIDSSWQYVVQGFVVLIAVYTDFLKKTGLFSSRKKRAA